LLGDIVSAPDFASGVLDVAARVAGAASPTEALELLDAAKAAMGVEQAVFVSYLRGDDAHENYRFMLAADPRWCLEYQASAWYASDPWLLYCSLHSEVTFASRIPALTPRQQKVQALAEKFGMVSVCIAPAASPTGARVGMLAMGSSRANFFEKNAPGVFKVLARSLVMEFHEWWSRHERKEMISTLGITDTDLHLLRLELKGSGTKRIAKELNLSIASVNSRWQRLNAKLGSPHRKFSTRLAARYGLI
jgi:DNA-binding CsgD family transcriptional regulator